MNGDMTQFCDTSQYPALVTFADILVVLIFVIHDFFPYDLAENALLSLYSIRALSQWDMVAIYTH